MNENCKDPYTFINDANCASPELKDIIDAYKVYINNMNDYCSKSDNVISNLDCNNFVENNKYIKNTEIQKNLKQNIPELCKNNASANLDKLCIDTYNIKPNIFIEKEKEKEKEKKKENNIILSIPISLFLLLGGGYIYYRKKKKVSN